MKFQGEIFLSELVGKNILAPDGERIGKIRDFTVIKGDVFPLIDAFVIKARAGGRRVKLAYDDIELFNRRFVLCRLPVGAGTAAGDQGKGNFGGQGYLG